ncbi:unnamed protein product [Rotaria sordida]|uniref:Helix-turn-helix domain-containing protein n=1 Tax=Rotaria sordida TaxID=392033 RepID=A0A815U5Q1_9BILA|nr:unnamed protein product [Rotaria sordida]CAF1660725.1 unnamed protein product [Rotaria sordida]
MVLRAIRYCSTFQAYLNEREQLRIGLLLNKYPNKFINEQFQYILLKFNIDQLLTVNNYDNYRQKVIDSPIKEKVLIDYRKTMFVHFTYCSNMKTFPGKFHTLWNKYFGESPINEVIPILGTRNRSKKDKNKKKLRRYLESNRILKWLEDHSRSSKNAISGRGNQAYVLASTSI